MKKPRMTIKLCVIATLCYAFHPYILPAKLTAVYQGINYDASSQENYRSTVILVDNPPITKKSMLSLWNRYIATLKNKNELLQDEKDEVLFVKNKFTSAYSSQELKYWQGDNQICLKGIFKGKCINNNEIIMRVSFLPTISSEQITSLFQNKVIYIDIGN